MWKILRIMNRAKKQAGRGNSVRRTRLQVEVLERRDLPSVSYLETFPDSYLEAVINPPTPTLAPDPYGGTAIGIISVDLVTKDVLPDSSLISVTWTPDPTSGVTAWDLVSTPQINRLSTAEIIFNDGVFPPIPATSTAQQTSSSEVNTSDGSAGQLGDSNSDGHVPATISGGSSEAVPSTVAQPLDASSAGITAQSQVATTQPSLTGTSSGNDTMTIQPDSTGIDTQVEPRSWTGGFRVTSSGNDTFLPSVTGVDNQVEPRSWTGGFRVTSFGNDAVLSEVGGTWNNLQPLSLTGGFTAGLVGSETIQPSGTLDGSDPVASGAWGIGSTNLPVGRPNWLGTGSLQQISTGTGQHTEPRSWTGGLRFTSADDAIQPENPWSLAASNNYSTQAGPAGYLSNWGLFQLQSSAPISASDEFIPRTSRSAGIQGETTPNHDPKRLERDWHSPWYFYLSNGAIVFSLAIGFALAGPVKVFVIDDPDENQRLASLRGTPETDPVNE